MKHPKQYFLSWFIFFFLLVSVPSQAVEQVSPLLLTFDIELESDTDALEKINLPEFATFFVTKEFAAKFPAPVRKLADQGTVGAYSKAYSKLTKDGLAAAKKDLQGSIEAIQAATGHVPIWFRVPPLEVNRELLSLARELGFKYDSSESERWARQDVLSEFPISINSTGRILFSDYDIFVTYGLDDQMALDLLKENYLNRKNSGRPFVLLLHPSIISQHTEVLHDFVKYVKQQGGACLSFDQYLAKTERKGKQVIGIHLDPNWPDFEVKQLTRDLLEFGVTDAFIRIQDESGGSYIETGLGAKVDALLKSLKAAGIKMHVTVPVLLNKKRLDGYPELAMVDKHGKASTHWLSPTHPQTISLLEQDIRQLVQKYDIDGVHLEHLAYPGLEYDYSAAAIKQFEKDNGFTLQRGKAAEVLMSNQYRLWISWRNQQLKQLLAGVAELMNRFEKKMQLSATLPGGAMIDFKEMEKRGTDFRLLGEYLDVVLTRPPLNEFLITNFSLSHIITMGRSVVGAKPILLDIPYKEDVQWSEYAFDHLVKEMESKVKNGIGGIVYPAYDYLATNPSFSGEGFENIFSLTDAFLRVDPLPVQEILPEKPVVSKVGMEEQQDIPAVEPVAEQDELFEVKENVALVAGTEIRLGALIVSLLVTLIMLIILTYFLFFKRIFAKKQIMKLETTTIIDWQSMDKSILDEQISGKLAHSVSNLLRTYNPTSTARYRVTLILDLVANTTNLLSVEGLMNIPLEIPGWRVLCRSYANEALMNRYLMEHNGVLKITEKGRDELALMTEQGFNAGQWIFVEQRMQEHLVVTCPRCGCENNAQWYQETFSCTGCAAVISFKECDSIERKTIITEKEA